MVQTCRLTEEVNRSNRRQYTGRQWLNCVYVYSQANLAANRLRLHLRCLEYRRLRSCLYAGTDPGDLDFLLVDDTQNVRTVVDGEKGAARVMNKCANEVEESKSP